MGARRLGGNPLSLLEARRRFLLPLRGEGQDEGLINEFPLPFFGIGPE